MPGVHDALVCVLQPYMSSSIASIFVRTTAVSLHKRSDELCIEDYPEIAEGLRGMLTPVASPALVEKTLREIRQTLEAAS